MRDKPKPGPNRNDAIPTLESAIMAGFAEVPHHHRLNIPQCKLVTQEILSVLMRPGYRWLFNPEFFTSFDSEAPIVEHCE